MQSLLGWGGGGGEGEEGSGSDAATAGSSDDDGAWNADGSYIMSAVARMKYLLGMSAVNTELKTLVRRLHKTRAASCQIAQFTTRSHARTGSRCCLHSGMCGEEVVSTRELWRREV